METTKRLVFVAIGLLGLTAGCGDDDLPAGNGRIWDCLGMISEKNPISGQNEVIQLVGPNNAPFTECADPTVSSGQVQEKCQSDCEDAWSGSFPWNFINTIEGIDTPDCTVTGVQITGSPCGGAVQGALLMNGGPSQTQSQATANMTVQVNGSSGQTTGTGPIEYSIGPCSVDTCDFRLVRLHLTSSAPFTIDGQTVSSADVQNFGDALGTFNVSSGLFSIPANAFQGQVNFVVDGRQGSMVLPNPQPMSGAISGDDLVLSGTLAMGSRSVSIFAEALATAHPPTINVTPDSSTVECTANHGAPVSFTANAADVDGDLRSVFWSVDQLQQAASGPTFSATLGVGTHTISATATDERGAAASDSSQITVADHTAPHFTFVPPAITISACTNPAIGVATAADACGSVTVTSNAPAVFHVGTTVVTWTAQDDAGNVATATQTVTVVLGDDRTCCPVGSNVIVGTSNNDVLTGTSGVDCIIGLGGQDRISGLGGNDVISGGEGDDIIDGGAGDDLIFGGGGQDTITGGTGNDTIFGDAGDDTIHGNDGNDTIHGGQGQDKLFGDAGNNSLFGDDGDDQLTGGPGNDLLNGGGIHDVCTGGGGTDTFVTCETRR